MKIEEYVKGKRIYMDDVDITDEAGFISVPSWQFALMVEKMEEYRLNMMMGWFMVIALAIALILINMFKSVVA